MSVCVCVRVCARSGFSTRSGLLSLSISFFLSVPAVHTLSIKAEGGDGGVGARDQKEEKKREGTAVWGTARVKK